MVCVADSKAEPHTILVLNLSLPEQVFELPADPLLTRLSPHHVEELRASGISSEFIWRSGIRTVSAAAVCRMLGWVQHPANVSSGWAIPFDDPNAPDCYWRVKLDQPRVLEGRLIKYESPVGSANRAYYPPGFDASDGSRIVITEGEKKALSAMAHGINCMGLTGVWNWQKPRKRDDMGRGYGQRLFIDDLAVINWANRDVVICFDSDAADKHSVELA